jgi:syntaxin-binding protein 1
MTFSTITLPVRFRLLSSRGRPYHTNSELLAIERIEERRESNPDMDAIYFLSPDAQIVDCLLADFEMRRYRRSFIVWLSLPELPLRQRVDDYPGIRQLRASSKTLNVDFYSRESHLVIFRDPWSFPMLYHPACNFLVANHMKVLAKRVRTLPIVDFPSRLQT